MNNYSKTTINRVKSIDFQKAINAHLSEDGGNTIGWNNWNYEQWGTPLNEEVVTEFGDCLAEQGEANLEWLSSPLNPEVQAERQAEIAFLNSHK